MPVAEVTSQGESLRLFYEVRGADASQEENLGSSGDYGNLKPDVSGGKDAVSQLKAEQGHATGNFNQASEDANRNKIDAQADGIAEDRDGAAAAEEEEMVPSVPKSAFSRNAEPSHRKTNSKSVTFERSDDDGKEAEDFAGGSNGPVKVIFIAGLSARGRTEFFQHLMDHLASLKDSEGNKVMSICAFDNRGIGGSTIPKKKKAYSTTVMAHDTLALLDHLQWETVHVVGMSLGGMIANKFAALWPERVASLSLIATTRAGWHMLAGVAQHPWLAGIAGAGPLTSKILANLRFNFSDGYLEEPVKSSKKSRRQILLSNTKEAIQVKDTAKFLAEGQPTCGREGQLKAVGFHRMRKRELRRIADAKIPCQVIVGRHDRLAKPRYVQKLARQLKAPLLILEAGHAGIVIEALGPVAANLESIILGNSQTNALRLRQLSAKAHLSVLQNQLYAREFASSFAPGRVSFGPSSSSE